MSIKLFLDTLDTQVVKSGINNTPSDSTFIFGEILPDSVTNVGVMLESASIPNIVPNIRPGRNTLDFFENGGAVLRTATVATGLYDANTLVTALQTAMNASGAANTYTVTYNSITKKILISTTLPNTFRILSSSTMLTQIGYDAMTSFDTTKTADYLINLLSTRYVDILVNFNTASIALNKRSNILQRVHFTESLGSIVFYQAQVPSSAVCSAESLRQIEVRLYDDTGSLYNLDKNHQCTYSLYLTPLD